jgi:hypothetical protein
MYVALSTSMDTFCADESLLLYLRMKDYQLHPCANIHSVLLAQKVCRDFASSLKPPVEVSTVLDTEHLSCVYACLSVPMCTFAYLHAIRQVFRVEKEIVLIVSIYMLMLYTVHVHRNTKFCSQMHT